MSKDWIQKAIKKPGALRKTAGAKKGKKIPAKTLTKLSKSSNPTTRKRANLAKTLRSFDVGGEVENGKKKEAPDKPKTTVEGRTLPSGGGRSPSQRNRTASRGAVRTRTIQSDVSRRADGIAQQGRTKGKTT